MSDREEVELESGHTFRMLSVHDIYRKLHRELQRFEAAHGVHGGSRADMMDTAVNFAWTAWHMVDWLYLRAPERIEEVYACASLKPFQDHVRRNHQALAVCDVIANAAKHGGRAHGFAGRPNVETILVAHAVEPEGDAEDVVVAMMQRTWSMKIRHHGMSEPADSLFRRAYGDLHRLLMRTHPDMG